MILLKLVGKFSSFPGESIDVLHLLAVSKLHIVNKLGVFIGITTVKIYQHLTKSVQVNRLARYINHRHL